MVIPPEDMSAQPVAQDGYVARAPTLSKACYDLGRRRRSDTAQGRTTGGWDMEATLLGAEPSAQALHQPLRGESDQHRPRSDGRQQDDQQTDVESSGSGGLIQRASTQLLVVGVGIAQLIWVAALGYATYSIWQRLPL